MGTHWTLNVFCPIPSVFYSALIRSEQCKFFKWADEEQGGGGGSSGPAYGGRGSGGGGRGSGPGLGNDGICSKCKQHGHFARQCTN